MHVIRPIQYVLVLVNQFLVKCDIFNDIDHVHRQIVHMKGSMEAFDSSFLHKEPVDVLEIPHKAQKLLRGAPPLQHLHVSLTINQSASAVAASFFC